MNIQFLGRSQVMLLKVKSKLTLRFAMQPSTKVAKLEELDEAIDISIPNVIINIHSTCFTL